MLINRQPVFDGKTCVQGYQSQTQGKATGDGSRRDLLNAIVENLDELAGGNHWAMVTLPLETIDVGAHEVLSRDRTIVRPLGKPSDKLFQRCLGKLSTQGYRMAVSAPEDGSAPSELAQIVHLNFIGWDRSFLAEKVERLHRSNARVMVSGIDAHEDFEFCKTAGVDLFEGRFFCQPVPGRYELPLTRIPTIRLLTA